MNVELDLLPGVFAVCRLDADAELPGAPALNVNQPAASPPPRANEPIDLPPLGTSGGAAFWSVTRTADELSVICPEDAIPEGAVVESGWRGLRVAGPLDFALTGVAAALTAPLAEAGISVLPVATFDTDYLFVREDSLPRALAALAAAGHTVP